MDTNTAADPSSPDAQTTSAPDPTRPDAPRLQTLLLTDLVDSTTLVERLGDGPAADLFRAHDAVVLRLQEQWRGRLIDRSDGLLLLFERPIDGLGFALDYARGLRDLGVARGLDLKARAGLHVGEVLTWRNTDEAVRVGSKPLEVEGLAKPMAGRLMTMARPGQILLSAIAEPLAHRAASELGERGRMLLWKPHGRWRFKGVPQVQEIFEVGEAGIAPLRSPLTSNKAWRDIPLWRRPAALATELVVLLVVGVGGWLALKPQPAIAFGERDWVVVGDLRNLTGQAVLDESLEQAFRISLEQSRYVNVLSDMKARDTLARMRRPSDTKLDRAIASEIAIRDGARAVILPTVSEVGGRVRVSAEVIDPHSQTTVYSESADGRGVQSTLDSIDNVTASLRSTLGEAMEAISQDSAPLPSVTTQNLEALRAYALGIEAYAQRRWDDARALFTQAVEIDPGFALAHMGLARIDISNANSNAAKPHLARALALRSRLTRRDMLYLDAWAAEFDNASPAEPMRRWRLLGSVYPDYAAAHFQYGWHLYQRHEFAAAAKQAIRATVPQEPLRGVAMELMGRTQLARGNAGAALQSFIESERVGAYPPTRRHVAALAAMRQYDAARKMLAAMDKTVSSDGGYRAFEAVSLAIEEGRLADARDTLDRIRRGPSTAPLLNAQLALMSHIVSLADGGGFDGTPPLRSLAVSEMANAQDVGDRDARRHLFVALAASHLAQRNGDTKLASEMIRSARVLQSRYQDASVAQLITVIEATGHRMSGKPDRAIRLLQSKIDGTELFQTHVALRDAYRDMKDLDAAASQDKWLQTHRGLAYIEPAGDQSLQSLNAFDVSRQQRWRATPATARDSATR